jgi:putative addiction module component (TIGR02574 family)
MPPLLPEIDVEQLSIPQRLELIAVLWDSIPESADMPLPEWHREELDQRVRAADADPGAGIPWEQVKARLREKP